MKIHGSGKSTINLILINSPTLCTVCVHEQSCFTYFKLQVPLNIILNSQNASTLSVQKSNRRTAYFSAQWLTISLLLISKFRNQFITITEPLSSTPLAQPNTTNVFHSPSYHSVHTFKMYLKSLFAPPETLLLFRDENF